MAASGAGIVKRSKLAQGIELEGYLNVGLGRSCAVVAGDAHRRNCLDSCRSDCTAYVLHALPGTVDSYGAGSR